MGQPEDTFWRSTPREVSARLEGLSILVSGDKEVEARQNADGIMALAASDGPVETIVVTTIIKLDDRRG